MNSETGFGPHLTLDLYGCNEHLLSDAAFISHILTIIPLEIGMHIFASPIVEEVPAQQGSFDQGGITGFVILVESHMSVHTFPSEHYASLDVFSCKKFNANAVTERISSLFDAKSVETNELSRGRSFVKHYPRNALKAADLAKSERKRHRSDRVLG